jgi:hypothetical protein
VSIREILDSSDVVFGLWQDPQERGGVGMYVIKGKNLMWEVLASDKPVKVVITAVPCESAEHAMAAEEAFGDQVN